MTIAAGTKLGRYEIRAKIGAGGMGEVYLAQDTKLDRKVALKILPSELAANKERSPDTILSHYRIVSKIGMGFTRWFNSSWLLILVCLSAAAPVEAQYRFDHWTADNGLPQNSVRDIR